MSQKHAGHIQLYYGTGLTASGGNSGAIAVPANWQYATFLTEMDKNSGSGTFSCWLECSGDGGTTWLPVARQADRTSSAIYACRVEAGGSIGLDEAYDLTVDLVAEKTRRCWFPHLLRVRWEITSTMNVDLHARLVVDKIGLETRTPIYQPLYSATSVAKDGNSGSIDTPQSWEFATIYVKCRNCSSSGRHLYVQQTPDNGDSWFDVCKIVEQSTSSTADEDGICRLASGGLTSSHRAYEDATHLGALETRNVWFPGALRIEWTHVNAGATCDVIAEGWFE